MDALCKWNCLWPFLCFSHTFSSLDSALDRPADPVCLTSTITFLTENSLPSAFFLQGRTNSLIFATGRVLFSCSSLPCPGGRGLPVDAVTAPGSSPPDPAASASLCSQSLSADHGGALHLYIRVFSTLRCLFSLPFPVSPYRVAWPDTLLMEGCIGDTARAFHLQPAQAKGGRAKKILQRSLG